MTTNGAIHLTQKEKEVIVKMADGWTCHGLNAWRIRPHKKLPDGLHLRKSEGCDGRRIPIHGRVAKSLVDKNIIRFFRLNSIYCAQWVLTNDGAKMAGLKRPPHEENLPDGWFDMTGPQQMAFMREQWAKEGQQ